MAHPTTIFYVYAETDEELRLQLEKHLALLQRPGVLTSWQESLAGAMWEQEREQTFNEAALILLMVSADFLASDVCYQEQMLRALERQTQGEVQVLPILVRPVEVTNAPFTHLRMVPTNGKPVTLWANQDAAWTHITEGIRCVLEGKPLPVIQEQEEAARYTTENQQTVYGQTIGEHNEIHQHYYLPANPPPAPAAASVKPIWMIPYPRNPFFTGRRELLTQLAATLHAGHPTALSQPQAISGLGGIGKTQIAIEYAYQYAQEYQAVLWAQADTRENLTSSCVALAGVLNLPEKEAAESAQVIVAVKRWLELETAYLLILDNADDLALARDFLPVKPGGHILLTTRAQVTGRFARKLEVETLSTEQGMLFLLRRAGLLAVDAPLEEAKEAERVGAKRLCEELGGLPLALDQAGAYIEETHCGLSGYQSLYRTRRAEILKERGGLIDDHPEPVAATWSLSFEKVEQKNPAAADLLRFCAFLHPDAIPEEILLTGAKHLGLALQSLASDPLSLNKAIAVLGDYSLISRDSKERTLSIHRLVQAVLKDAMDVATQRDWAQRAVLAVNETFPTVDFPVWQKCEQCLPQALACAELIEQENLMLLEAASLLHRMGRYLNDRGRYAEAEPVCQHALLIRERLLGREHLDTMYTLNNLALAYSGQGQYAEAEPLLKRALFMKEQQLEPDHISISKGLHNLAKLYSYEGKYAEAEPLFRRALSMREQQLGLEHPLVAFSLTGLADLFYKQCQYAEADPLYLRALVIREHQLEAEHPDTAQSLNNLACLYVAQRKYEQAELLLKRALSMREHLLGVEHPDTVISLIDLAGLYGQMKKYAEAKRLSERVLRIYERTVGLEHPKTQIARGEYTALFTLAMQKKESEDE